MLGESVFAVWLRHSASKRLGGILLVVVWDTGGGCSVSSWNIPQYILLLLHYIVYKGSECVSISRMSVRSINGKDTKLDALPRVVLHRALRGFESTMRDRRATLRIRGVEDP